MNPAQKQIAKKASELAEKTAGSPMLWEYTDPEGNKFYLETRMTTVRSPFTGKSFSAHPVKHTPSQVGQEMKKEDHPLDNKGMPPAKTASDTWKI